MSELIYEASVYSRKVSYRNFKGEQNDVELFFALDPLQLMKVIANVPVKRVKSGNPSINGTPSEMTDGDQIQLVRDLACQAAGSPSDDGESWVPFEHFSESLVGKAFLTRLASSDGDRREFSEKVILDPFRAFIGFAIADPTNSPKDVQGFKVSLQQMENIFKAPDPKTESVDERRERLAAEMAALDAAPATEA